MGVKSPESPQLPAASDCLMLPLPPPPYVLCAARTSPAECGLLYPVATTQETVQQVCWLSVDAATSASSSSAVGQPETSSAAPAAATASDAAAAAAAAAAAPAWAAHSGVKTLDGLPMPAWIVAVPKPKRAPVGLQVRLWVLTAECWSGACIAAGCPARTFPPCMPAACVLNLTRLMSRRSARPRRTCSAMPYSWALLAGLGQRAADGKCGRARAGRQPAGLQMLAGSMHRSNLAGGPSPTAGPCCPPAARCLQEAIKTVQSLARAKFDETVELHMRLGIDPRRGDQVRQPGAAQAPGQAGQAAGWALHPRRARQRGSQRTLEQRMPGPDG